MRPFSIRSLTTSIPSAAIALSAVFIFSIALMPSTANAATFAFTSATATSTNVVYVNPGLATTTRVTTGDTVHYQLNLAGTPWVAPQIDIFAMGSVPMSGSAGSWYYATTTSSDWIEGPVTFSLSYGGAFPGDATTTKSEADLSGTNVTFDKTSPFLISVAWNDLDSSTQLSGGDTLILTWSETMATTTLSTGNLDTNLSLTNSHTFGTTGASPTPLAIGWNSAGTVLTITLGSNTTATGADHVLPLGSAVFDAVGNQNSQRTAISLPDTTPPLGVTGNTGGTFSGSATVTLASIGSSQILYTTDGTTPDCFTGTVYSSPLTVASSMDISAIGCDEAFNATSVVTASYSITAAAPVVVVSNPGAISVPAVGGSGALNPLPNAGAISLRGLSASQIQSILDVLSSFHADAAVIRKIKASLEGTTPGREQMPTVYEFKLNLTIGSIGEGVQALQRYLNAHGFTVAESGAGSVGNETRTFGPATKAALVKYQKAHTIVPAFGYFGATTRAAVNAGK